MADSHGEKTSAHTEADGGEHAGGFPPFESSTFASQLVSLAIFFVALYVIVSRIACGPAGMTSARARAKPRPTSSTSPWNEPSRRT